MTDGRLAPSRGAGSPPAMSTQHCCAFTSRAAPGIHDPAPSVSAAVVKQTLSQRLDEGLVAFAWDEWAQMGVAASARRRSPWVQDPEALVVFTLEVARDDPRLFDELLDWLLLNEQLLSVRRLRAMCADPADERLLAGALG